MPDARTIETVTGPVDADSMGVTLPHEHVYFDTSPWLLEPDDPAKQELRDQPIRLDNLNEIARDPLVNRENLRFADHAVAAAELAAFQAAGGTTIIDVTPVAMARDVASIRRLSEETGVQIVAGTGHYVQATHPLRVATQSVEEIAREMIDEIVDGIEGTNVRPGVIGEIGVSDGIHPDERKVLQAAARAQRETGLAISIHCPIPREKAGMVILRILEQAGADISRCVLGHLSHTSADLDYHRRLADTGACLQYDRFGAEFYYESWGYREPRDADVVSTVATLVSEGYGNRIMLSHDVCYRLQMQAWGGGGYTHVLRHVGPYLRESGVSDDQVQRMLVETPARIFPLSSN